MTRPYEYASTEGEPGKKLRLFYPRYLAIASVVVCNEFAHKRFDGLITRQVPCHWIAQLTMFSVAKASLCGSCVLGMFASGSDGQSVRTPAGGERNWASVALI